ncbi:hypothetical protein FUAX_24430 [Fulvitalea axinellae]|uniref:Adhesin n=1 Tax=Fulvitalea axinellae TaxID=1182444 RepID=A0AAU9CD03_9BACT|nr:hypothetical protein FUAX_24430 [Fulvitalea axinellae]
MAILNRKTLKNFFRKGQLPSEVHFASLIESTVNKVDDGFAKSLEDGLQLSPQGSSSNLLSFFRSIRDKGPKWNLAINPSKDAEGLSINDLGKMESALFLKEGGGIGIRTIAPKYDLDVNGWVGMKGRTGTYLQGEVPADGRWHPILVNMDRCVAFEIVARVGAGEGRGKYALAHIVALCAFGKSKSKVNINQSYFGWFMNRIKARWVGDVKDFSLELGTASHYGLKKNGDPFKIKYRVTQIWDDRV